MVQSPNALNFATHNANASSDRPLRLDRGEGRGEVSILSSEIQLHTLRLYPGLARFQNKSLARRCHRLACDQARLDQLIQIGRGPLLHQCV
jgi:hypothetical protein